MRKIAVILLGAVMAGALSYVLYLEARGSRAPAHEAVFDNLRWLRAEFDLEPEQLEAITAVYEEYRPTCEALCLRVMSAREKLDTLLVGSDTVTPEVREALEEYARVKEECHRAMLEHVYEVAGHMPPEQRDRYLERATAYVTMHDAAD